jgi:hypothetical protein
MMFSVRRGAERARRSSTQRLRPIVEGLEQRLVLTYANGNGPVVTALTALPNTNQLVISFDGRLTAGPAADIANYQVAKSTSDPELITQTGTLDPVISAVYSDSSGSQVGSQVTLTLQDGLASGTFYRIWINGTPNSMSVNPSSNPLTGMNGVLFDGDNDDTPSGDFYGLLAAGTSSHFVDSNGDKITLAVKGGGALDVWRELDGDIDQLSVVGPAAASSTLTGSVRSAKVSRHVVYIGSVTIPVPMPLVLNGATDKLRHSFVVLTHPLNPPPPEPSAISPRPAKATARNVPYTLKVVPISTSATPNLPGLQSADFAQSPPTAAHPNGLWLVFGGRTNGLHSFTPSGVTNFPPDLQNEDIYVIDPANWRVWSMPWSQSGVPASAYNSLTSADQEFYQEGDTLYTVGGYSVPDTIKFAGKTTAGSTTITVANPAGLAVGQAVTGPGIPLVDQKGHPLNVTITDVSGSTVTLSQAATATASDVALTASTDNFTTFDTLTALSVSGVIGAVIGGGDVASAGDVRQVSDPRLAVTGGNMGILDGRIYLVFGQAFQGGYKPETAPPTFTQIYTDEVRSFNLIETSTTLAIDWSSYEALRDPINFRRRDGNIGEVIEPNGKPGLAYYGGVFTPGDAYTAYRAPILISDYGQARVDDAYQQYFSQYTTALFKLFNARNRTMNTLLFGGIGGYYYAPNGKLTAWKKLGPPGPPWVNTVTSLVQRANGSYREFSFAPLPGFYGANSAFFANPRVPAYGNGVIKLDQLKRTTTLGYIYGGIYSPLAQAEDATQTGASNQVFAVILTRRC